MDTFNEQMRRIGMMLVYGQTVEEIHDVIEPEDEAQFYLVFKAAQRWAALSVDGDPDRL